MSDGIGVSSVLLPILFIAITLIVWRINVGKEKIKIITKTSLICFCVSNLILVVSLGLFASLFYTVMLLVLVFLIWFWVTFPLLALILEVILTILSIFK